jgi:hypothetical protein
VRELLNYDDENHEYFILADRAIHIPSVSEILKPIMSDFEIPSFYAERGTKVHEATELYDHGKYLPELVDPMVIPYLVGYDNFHQEHDVEYEESEMMVFNENLFYAGRLDRIWKVDGDYFLTDIKTGGKYRWHPLQLVGYRLSCGGELKLSSLYLREFEYKWHEWGDVTEAMSLFLALVDIYWFQHPADYKRLMKI